ncbi:20072_t:CDS:2 [Gigaspora margarita]|uniref:20072_t:CDS:1 n=1 Tax=Gigaspora margarita TaxID=4874 RepID=A0ABN7VWU3_GIGMA|nr:20072_t:CDS:2 [Gigaspora margarita]
MVDEYYNELERLYQKADLTERWTKTGTKRAGRNGMAHNYPTSFKKAKATETTYSRRVLLKATSHESKSARKVELVDSLNSLLDQLIPNNISLSLILNSRIEILNVLSIKITYCEAAIKQHSIYLILNMAKKISVKSGRKPTNYREYESEEVEEERSYIVQEDEDKKKFQLEIEKGPTKDSKLKKEQQIQIEELLKKNKNIFAEGLTQLGRIKKEVHKIVIKEGVKSIKQRPY